MKDQLTKLYKRNLKAFKLIRDTFPNGDLPGPFLMSPNSLYGSQKNKLLIAGQQTKGWSIRQFCRLKHRNLPKKSFRSYRPKALHVCCL